MVNEWPETTSSRLDFPRLLKQPRTVDRIASQLFLDPQELIVFGDAIRAAGAAGLDLAAVGGDGDVGDRGVLGFTGAVADHAGPAGPMSHLDGLEGLGQGADLVDLDQDAIGAALGDALGQAFGVGDVEVVADDLDLVAQALVRAA